MRNRRPQKDASKCALCPTVTADLRRGLCFTCYQRQLRNGIVTAPACCIGYGDNGCRIDDPRLLRPCGDGLRCLNCAMLARLAQRLRRGARYCAVTAIAEEIQRSA